MQMSESNQTSLRGALAFALGENQSQKWAKKPWLGMSCGNVLRGEARNRINLLARNPRNRCARSRRHSFGSKSGTDHRRILIRQCRRKQTHSDQHEYDNVIVYSIRFVRLAIPHRCVSLLAFFHPFLCVIFLIFFALHSLLSFIFSPNIR